MVSAWPSPDGSVIRDDLHVVKRDLAVVAQMADRILVLRDGAERENGATPQIINQPKDDYTRSLIAAASPKSRTGEAVGEVATAPTAWDSPARSARTAAASGWSAPP